MRRQTVSGVVLLLVFLTTLMVEVATAGATPEGVLFDRLPAEHQLFPRGADGSAEISINGYADDSRYQHGHG